jgi:hypothetical protein
MWQMSPIAAMVVEPVISVPGPLAERIRQAAKAAE